MIRWTYLARIGLPLALLGSLLPGMRSLAQNAPSFVPGRLLVQFRRDVPADQVRTLVAAANAQDTGQIPHIGVHVLKLPAGAGEAAMARAFARRPEVVFAELDEIRKPDATAVTNDPYYGSEWHLPKISAPTAWSYTTGSSSVIIAILDTGCDPTHPDLAPKYVPGWNTYDNTSDTHDVYGHGTAVAGTAAACSNNGSGVTSVAWGCQIMPMRISDTGGYGYGSTIASALTWAADHGARVANISYAMTWSSTISSAAQYFASKGGVVAMSAGNSGTVDTTTPDNPYILTVSATDSADNLASWSTTGNDVDLAAPGVGIYTTCNGGGYGSWSGTSFSAPIVAGVAALVLSVNPSLTASQVQDVLKQSADDKGTVGWDPQFGWGRVNAARAVSLAGGTADTTPPTLSFTNPTDGATVSGSLSVQVNAADNISVASVTLYLDGVAVASSSAAPYTFPWNTLAVANGTHTLSAVAADGFGNTAGVQVSVSVYNAPDTTAPTVSIVSPTGGSIGNTLSVSASAADNVGVVKVELWVDGKLVATDTGAPWAYSLNTRKWATGSHTLQCKAYDAAGNIGLSQTVTVTK